MIIQGSSVQRLRVNDGTPDGGKPTGRVLTVVSIRDHCPVDGPDEKGVVALLSDGGWSFIWNLSEVK